MHSWPLLVVKSVAEDVRVEQISDLYSFLDYGDQVVFEEVRIYVGVLMLDNVVDYLLDCPDLVVLDRSINSGLRV